MVDVLTYKATKVYTPQTNEWADAAKTAQAAGKQLSGTLKDLGKKAEVKEKQEAAEQKALAKEKKSDYDKIKGVQANNFAQRYQIDLARQTAFINERYTEDPTNPEKENEIRAVAKDLQAVWSEKIPQDVREEFLKQAKTKTNDYILSDLKSGVAKQIKDADKDVQDSIGISLEKGRVSAGTGNFDEVRKNFIEERSNLQEYMLGRMHPEDADIALRQYDRKYITNVINGIASYNPQLAQEIKDNPAAMAQILGGGDFLTELATRSELNKGMEQIDGMEFPKNGRYQKEKERAKLMNSLGVVEVEYNNGGQPAKTISSASANPELTRYVAELTGGGVGKDLDLAIKNANNTQKAKLEQAKYDGEVQAILSASYSDLDKIKGSDLYNSGDEGVVDFANRYEKMLDERKKTIDANKPLSLLELNEAYNNLGLSLSKIDGKDTEPVLDSYAILASIETGMNNSLPADDTYSKLESVYQRAVLEPEFRDNLVKTIAAANILDHYAELFSVDAVETDPELQKTKTTAPWQSGIMYGWKTGKPAEFNYAEASEKNKAKYNLVRDTYINAMADVANQDFESANKKIFALPYNVAFINYNGKIKQEDLNRFMEKDAKGDNTPVTFMYNGYTFEYLGTDKTGTIKAKRRL